MKKSKYDLFILFIFSFHLINLLYSYFRGYLIEWFSLFIVLMLSIIYICFLCNKPLQKNKESHNKE